MATWDVAVVGAGVAGAAAAHALAERGARVLLLERGRPGERASGAAAGMLAPASEALAPGPFLDAGLASLAAWPQFAARLAERGGVDCELRLDGLLRIPADAADAEALAAAVAWQRRAGVVLEALGADGAVAADPGLAAAPHGAVLYPEEGHVGSRAVVTALVGALESLGGEVRSGAEVVGADAGGRLRLAGGGPPVTAGAVVLAAGAWSEAAAVSLGLAPLPVRPVRGQLVVLRGVRTPPRLVLFAGRLGYAVTKRDGTVLVGATEVRGGFDETADPDATRSLLAVGRRLLAGAGQATLAAVWTGLRPMAPDGLPVVGRHGCLGGGVPVVVASGHYRNGVLLAPLTGAAVAELVTTGTEPAALAAFAPSRLGAAPPGRMPLS